MTEPETAELAQALHRIGAVKFGDFVLKDGRQSPFYLDLRALISHPPVLRLAAQHLVRLTAGLSFARIAGIPYAGLPLAVAMSLESGCPMIFARKEAKAYGTMQQVEGQFAAGERVLVVDDVITSGGAKLEGLEPLRAAGVEIRDVAVVVERGDSGRRRLQEAGLALHAVLTATTLFECLARDGVVTRPQIQRALDFLAES